MTDLSTILNPGGGPIAPAAAPAAASPAAPPDFTAKYNTPLSPDKEDEFQTWLKQMSQKRGYDMTQEMRDYDLRGLWKEKGGFDARGHATDEFKKPNHPTFSNESIYSGVNGFQGGEWTKSGDAWNYQASPTNLQMYGSDALSSYFKRIEPDSKLTLPDAQ